MHLHGYPAAVIHYRDAVIFIDGYIDLCTVTGEGLVNGIVNNLINR
jgi:NADH:ubiquinone oxidoreductase subunit B-like Fe-S oxidoreductase